MKKTMVENTDKPDEHTEMQNVDVSGVKFGKGEALSIISGPCVVESLELQLEAAHELKRISERLGIGVVFKSSFEKDNRGTEKNYKGIGRQEGLDVLMIERRSIVGNPAQCGECIPNWGEVVGTFSNLEEHTWLYDYFQFPDRLKLHNLDNMQA